MSYTTYSTTSGKEGDRLRKAAGRWLKDLRTDAGLTQRELAERVGLGYYTIISQIESGYTRLPPERQMAYAESLGQDPAEFAKELLSYYDPYTYKALFQGRKGVR